MERRTQALQAAIDRIVERVETAQLSRAARALSAAYRAAPDQPRPADAMPDDAARVAYLVTRFPGTLAALSAVARWLSDRLPLAGTRELLELGAGPGPSLWALAPLMPALGRVRLVDADHRMLAVARELAEAAPVPAGATIETISGDLARLPALPAADVVVLSYTLGEVAAPDRARVVEAAWAATRDTLIVIDPGTSPGFERVRLARARLVEMGARVAAPCPHGAPCPMTAPDWCHVAARTDRTRLHRRLKGGSLGYEDEKFSYVAVTRRDPGAPAARIVARPQPRTGLVTLRLCTRDGLRIETVSRRHGPRYRAARHAAWGDEWDR